MKKRKMPFGACTIVMVTKASLALGEKLYKDPNNLISACLRPENSSDIELGIICDCLGVSELDQLSKESSGVRGSRTKRMEEEGITLKVNSSGDITISLADPIDELPFTKKEKNLSLREKNL